MATKKTSTTTKKKTTTSKKKNTSTKKTTPKKKTTAKQNVTPIPTKINIVEQTISNNNTKKKNTLKKVYTIIICILSAALLVSCIIEGINILTPPENELPVDVDKPTPTPEESEYEKINKLFTEDLDLDIYREENNNAEIVGRLEIPGVFNLLLTQTKDNDYYIEYNIKRKRSNKGTEFVDYRTKLTDKQVNVYGHNSRLYDLPFKNLEKFLEKDFFDKNEYILLQDDNNRRIYQIVSIKRVTTDYEHMKVDTKGKEHTLHIEKLLANSTHQRDVKYDENTNILVLQTCTREKSVQAFYVLTAFEINVN